MDLAPQALAALHYECLPSSLPARLGEVYLHEMYRYILGSRQEIVFGSVVGNALRGAAVVSLRPTTLSWRLLLRTRVLPHAAMGLRQASTAQPHARVYHSALPSFRPRHMPELVWIFVATETRGQALGSQLIAKAEACLRAKGVENYYVRTFLVDTKGAVRFYERHGFRTAGRMKAWSGQFRCMTKRL